MTLYTDIDAACCEVLSARVADGGLAPGEVWRRDVRTLTAEELAPFAQVHLFCGIGGSPLGLRWAGWPDEWPIVTGGFPCQDISSAGKGAGLDGERSGLYREALRVVEIKQPVGAILENVGALSARGLDRVAGALESLGYEVEALRVGSWAVGAPDKRERWWFVCRRVGWAGGLVYAQRAGRAGRADAGAPEVTEQRDAGEPRRWPHPRWFVIEEIDGRKVERTIPTPQHPWEPPRLFPGTRTVNARWRLALMGYPLHWLDVPHHDGNPRTGEKLARWWNKQGVAMTGNAQNPCVVAVIARAMIEAARRKEAPHG